MAIITIFHEIRRILTLIRCLPKTIYFNFHYLPLKEAIRLPIFIAYNIQLLQLKGSVHVHHCKTGSVQIGFNGTGIVTSRGEAWWNSTGDIYFNGRVRISGTPKLFITGTVIFKCNFNAGYNFLLSAHHKVCFEENLLISWNVSVMDTDGHKITNLEKDVINHPAPIYVGSHSWLGCHSTLLKGCYVAENSIIASHSLVTKKFLEPQTMIAGSPARVIKQAVLWEQ